MSFFDEAPAPESLLGYHRVLSPNAAIKVSPICLGGISIGSSWAELFGKNEDPFSLLDSFYSIGGNFIDTSSIYNAEESEKLIGEWMEMRGVRDQMVIATKYSSSYRAHNREKQPIQSNFTGNSAKSLRLSVRDSLQKLRTDYVDVLYVHWWDFTTSVEEVMIHLNALVVAGKVLYLGISDTPAWVVMKANSFARAHGMTPFSVYQGQWNVGDRDMEAEIIPMCEDQGMCVISWGSLGGGQLSSNEERQKRKLDPDARKGSGPAPDEVLSHALETLAEAKKTSVQAVALAYLLHQTPYMVPIVGVNSVEHIRNLPDALSIQMSDDDIEVIHKSSPFDPGFPMKFLYNYKGGQPYSLRLTPADNQHYRMGAQIVTPPKALSCQPRSLRQK